MGLGVCGTHTYGAGCHMTPSRPTLMGLGVMGPGPDPHLWGWGDVGPTLMGLGNVWDPHLWGWGVCGTPSRPTLVGLGVT